MIIHESTHIILCTIVALIGYRYYRSFWVWVASFLFGFFLDADHLFDYFLYRHGLHFNFSEFVSGNYFNLAGKVYLPFHGFEYAVIFIIIALIIRKRSTKCRNAAVFLTMAAISLSLHLVYDTIYYHPRILTYFISYRAAHHFRHNDFGFPLEQMELLP